jgi:putative aldouronate transport system permease protein
LKNTYLALIIPLLGNVMNIFLIRTFFQQIPSAIIESATIDGASDFGIFIKMILPLSTPVLATVGLLQLLSGWNSWNPALLYITKQKLYPLQYLLQVMLLNIQEITNNMQNNMGISDNGLTKIPTENTRMAMCILAIGPMLIVFPFFQKYFSQGLTVGSVKG